MPPQRTPRARHRGIPRASDAQYIRRQPLGVLPTTPSGNVNGKRRKLIKPWPVYDKENYHEFRRLIHDRATAVRQNEEMNEEHIMAQLREADLADEQGRTFTWTDLPPDLYIPSNGQLPGPFASSRDTSPVRGTRAPPTTPPLGPVEVAQQSLDPDFSNLVDVAALAIEQMAMDDAAQVPAVTGVSAVTQASAVTGTSAASFTPLRFQSTAELLARIDSLRQQTINNHAAAQPADHPRLSMPIIDSDDSGSEPDLSVLGMARPGGVAQMPTQQTQDASFAAPDETEDEDDEDPDQYAEEDEDVEEDDETSVDDLGDGRPEDETPESPLFDPATVGLKEVSGLARFTVSTHKPGNGIAELRSDDTRRYWQYVLSFLDSPISLSVSLPITRRLKERFLTNIHSRSDGPQPHSLTLYFNRRVEIRDIRFYVDYQEDESYTPTKIVFKAGISENQLIDFATILLHQPTGWQQVSVAGAGGGPDGNTLVAWVLQMQILENHQNGKDTHLRGIRVFTFDNDSVRGPTRDGNPVEEMADLIDAPGAGLARETGQARYEPGEGGLAIPDFMRELELR